LRTPSVHRSGSESAVCEGTALGSDRFGNSTIAATMAIEDARRFDLAIDLSYQCWLLNT
jgi:hypothetical protein